MARVVVSGWQVGFRKIGMVKHIRLHLPVSLSTAKGMVDGLLEGKPFIVDVDRPDEFIEAATSLGAIADRLEEECSER